MNAVDAQCPDELTLSVYADGELRGAEADRVAEHLSVCSGCRGLLGGLEAENVVLRGVLSEEGLERVGGLVGAGVLAGGGGGELLASEAAADALRPRNARPGSGSQPGMAAAVAIAALTPFALEWAWQSMPSLPAGLSWLGSFGSYGSAMSLSRGLYRFFVGGENIMLSSIGFSATLLVVLGVLAMMAARKRAVRGAAAAVAAALVLFGGLAPAGEAHAAEFRHDEEGTVRVDAGETIEDTVFLGGETVIMAGTIDGDVFAGAERVEITGTVHGNVYAAGESVTITGAVDGNVHAAGETVEVGTKIGGSGFLAGQRVTVTEESDLTRGAFVAGETVTSRGHVGRDLFFAADEMVLDGSVERNVSGYGTEVAVGATGSVGGDFRVTVPDQDAVEIDGAATIAGATTIDIDERTEHRAFMSLGFYFALFAKALAMVLIGWLLVTIFPKLRPSPPETSGEVLKDMGVGFLALVATPVAIVILLVTIIGIPIALVLAVIYALLLFLSTLVVADFAGQRLPFGSDTGAGLALRTGVALLGILFITAIPFIGGGLNFLITIFGLGVLLMHLRQLYLSRGNHSGGTPMPTAGPDVGALPA